MAFPILLLLIAVGIFPSPLDAGIRASFSVDNATWQSDAVVIVQTTADPVEFRVTQSLKGNLKPGDSLRVPDLRPTPNSPPLSPEDTRPASKTDPRDGVDEDIPNQPVGSSLILFLKVNVKGDSQIVSREAHTRRHWEPADGRDMKVSAVWIQDGNVYHFQQWRNPGPSSLSLWFGRCVPPTWEYLSRGFAPYLIFGRASKIANP